MSSRSAEVEKLSNLFDQLFPICRSITGPGIRESMQILASYMPIEIKSVPTGTAVFDWEVPPEWKLKEGWLKDPDGNKIADFLRSNLEVMNFAESVDRNLSLAELQPYLHSLPNLPDAIPYVTSYYKRNWGFSLKHSVRTGLKEGQYHAYISSEHPKGELNYGETSQKGDSDKIILLTSYLCHPSLANNELSGPMALSLLYQRIAKWKKRRYTYRFLVNPETIGTLVYLWKNGDELKKKLVSGLVLTCVGGQKPRLSYKTSRRENSLLDQLVGHLNGAGNLPADVRAFTPISGSDERQYCSPGFNLPMGQFARSVYGEYEGYHNSLDTKEFMGIETLVDSVDHIEKTLLALEYSGNFQNLQPFGEPQLGKRELYPTMNSPQTAVLSNDQMLDGREYLNALLTILNYSDGTMPMVQIAEKLNVPIAKLFPIIDKLEEKGLLKLCE